MVHWYITACVELTVLPKIVDSITEMVVSFTEIVAYPFASYKKQLIYL